MRLEVLSNSVAETLTIAKIFTKALNKGDIVLLNGDLGAGKTHFAKGMAEGLNIKETVTSPTFTIMNAYFGGVLPFYHLDMYRIENEDEVFELGLEDFVFGVGGITAIEWNRYSDFRGKRVFEALIERVGDEKRKISIKQTASAKL
ncbi:MAG: tRNA (adenosine(37)-N6)-threonylcarbamoyltransferase complex ATPase subunit type 1 TsaE [Clostridiales bacterium]|nr:tRNA (adenosine(37)-N6)-threonylcarbamoyltransferase complex ATPase subunit type 1 TsaE [Clostridiales bacterium]